MATIAEYLIYALGGGHGHARRGLLLQQALAQYGIASVVLLNPGSDIHFPVGGGPRHYALSLDDDRLARLLRNPPSCLVIDTFPQGWRGEIDRHHLARFAKTYWIARYSKNLGDIPTHFGRTLLPYPEGLGEWDRPWRPVWKKAIHTGYMVDASHWKIANAGRGFTVLDPEGRCSGRLLSAFARTAHRVGLDFAYHRRLARPFDVAKLLVVGAGYHTFYELSGLGIDVRFMPVRKRYDDQFLRAGRFGLALSHLDQLLPWLDGPPSGRFDYAAPDWSRVAQALEV
ncbi:MAG: hypothetical protein ACOYMG_05300 [Candidatus Methylumidiphilus sp.]